MTISLTALVAQPLLRKLTLQQARKEEEARPSAQDPKAAAAADTAKKIEQGRVQAGEDARSARKTRARETLTRLGKDMDLIKRMWAHDPQQMAKQLARLARELKAVVKEFASAAKEGGEALSEQHAALAAGASAAAPIETAEKKAETSEAEGDQAEEAAADAEADAQPAHPPSPPRRRALPATQSRPSAPISRPSCGTRRKWRLQTALTSSNWSAV
jgi:hypothetical protein